ncbi:MAG: hypothetical protein IPG88_21715 [Gemmatimonadetes bacterium]|nr:hypothetical protein [Gemmatimonadota bacterium]
MSSIRQNVQLGLADPDAPDAQRVLLFRLLVANAHEVHTAWTGCWPKAG